MTLTLTDTPTADPWAHLTPAQRRERAAFLATLRPVADVLAEHAAREGARDGAGMVGGMAPPPPRYGPPCPPSPGWTLPPSDHRGEGVRVADHPAVLMVRVILAGMASAPVPLVARVVRPAPTLATPPPAAIRSGGRIPTPRTPPTRTRSAAWTVGAVRKGDRWTVGAVLRPVRVRPIPTHGEHGRPLTWTGWADYLHPWDRYGGVVNLAPRAPRDPGKPRQTSAHGRTDGVAWCPACHQTARAGEQIRHGVPIIGTRGPLPYVPGMPRTMRPRYRSVVVGWAPCPAERYGVDVPPVGARIPAALDGPSATADPTRTAARARATADRTMGRVTRSRKSPGAPVRGGIPVQPDPALRTLTRITATGMRPARLTAPRRWVTCDACGMIGNSAPNLATRHTLAGRVCPDGMTEHGYGGVVVVRDPDGRELRRVSATDGRKPAATPRRIAVTPTTRKAGRAATRARGRAAMAARVAEQRAQARARDAARARRTGGKGGTPTP